MPDQLWTPCGGNTLDKYEVKILSKALRDLDSIYAYIARSLLEPDMAAKLINELEEQILSLEYMPYRCPERRTGAYANKGYRQPLAKNYTVIYRVDESAREVLIVTVRYSRSIF